MTLLVKPHHLVNSRRFEMQRIIHSWLALGLLPLVTMSVFADEKASQADREQKAARKVTRSSGRAE